MHNALAHSTVLIHFINTIRFFFPSPSMLHVLLAHLQKKKERILLNNNIFVQMK